MTAFFMSLLIDILSTCSIIGIWPRFIEPYRLQTTELKWGLDKNSHHLDGLKIVHLSDLHFHVGTPQKFLNKIILQIRRLRPDLILFTGDFLCYSQLEHPEKLSSFLCNLEAPLGSFCSFGNHDYAKYVTLNREGIYDTQPPLSPLKGICRGLSTLIFNLKTSIKFSKSVLSIPLNEKLCNILHNTPFRFLENATATLPIGLNITGIGDLSLGRCNPDVAFADYNKHFPGIVLSHNPDTFPILLNYPGSWILSGHTHGEQIHIPWPKWGRNISRKLARLENSLYTRGLYTANSKKLYVNRGLGCHKPFRLFSPPEICLIRTVKL